MCPRFVHIAEIIYWFDQISKLMFRQDDKKKFVSALGVERGAHTIMQWDHWRGKWYRHCLTASIFKYFSNTNIVWDKRSCDGCKYPVHSICQKRVGKEEYGSKVLYYNIYEKKKKESIQIQGEHAAGNLKLPV